jgi:PTS system nitrogen regulatory IIA component
VPEQATQAHLDILSELAQLFSEKSSRDGLREAPDAAAVAALLANWAPVRPAA